MVQFFKDTDFRLRVPSHVNFLAVGDIHVRSRDLLSLLFTVCKSPIMHRVCPQNFCITFVLNFAWVLQSSQEKLKTMATQNFGGANKVHYGRCASGEYYSRKSGKLPTYPSHKPTLTLTSKIENVTVKKTFAWTDQTT